MAIGRMTDSTGRQTTLSTSLARVSRRAIVHATFGPLTGMRFRTRFLVEQVRKLLSAGLEPLLPDSGVGFSSENHPFPPIAPILSLFLRQNETSARRFQEPEVRWPVEPPSSSPSAKAEADRQQPPVSLNESAPGEAM